MPTTVSSLRDFMQRFAPPALSESWDNTGLLLGDPARKVTRVMTCLTITPTTAAEAVREGAEMIVSHHPMPFRALKRITAESTVGRILRELIRADMAVYSPHTSFDSAAAGINQQIAAGLNLMNIAPLKMPEWREIPLFDTESETPPVTGTGRVGELPAEMPLEVFLERVQKFFALPYVQYVGDLRHPVKRVGVGCGAAGEFLEFAQQHACDVFLTGETNYHTHLEAEATGTALILMTHFASERFACVNLAETLKTAFPALHIWGSRDETDPLRTWAN